MPGLFVAHKNVNSKFQVRKSWGSWSVSESPITVHGMHRDRVVPHSIAPALRVRLWPHAMITIQMGVILNKVVLVAELEHMYLS